MNVILISSLVIFYSVFCVVKAQKQFISFSSYIADKFQSKEGFNCDKSSFILPAEDRDKVVHMKDFNTHIYEFYIRCRRQTPYYEIKALNPVLTPQLYFNYLKDIASSYESDLNEQIENYRKTVDSRKVYPSPSDPDLHPSKLSSRGSYFFTAIFHLEHYAEQIEYLVETKKLPLEFQEITTNVRSVVIPRLLQNSEKFKSCEYISRGNNTPLIGGTDPSCTIDNVKHSMFYLSYDVSTKYLYGTFNRLIYLPPSLPRSPMNAFGLNFKNPWKEIEESYQQGFVTVVDNFLTDNYASRLYNLALDGTVFFDGYKPGYMAAFLNDGLNEGNFEPLIEDIRAFLPNIVGDLPLVNAWIFKSDSITSKRSVTPHADLALVNINLWLTPDEANLKKGTGGLKVYDISPMDIYDRVWQSQGDGGQNIKEWLIAHNATSTSIPYKCNRAVIFDSSRIHESEIHHFKPGYKDRRINLTLLFGFAKTEKTSNDSDGNGNNNNTTVDNDGVEIEEHKNEDEPFTKEHLLKRKINPNLLHLKSEAKLF